MNDVDAIFFLESMKASLMGAIQRNNETLNKYEATAANMLTLKNVQAIEIGIQAIKGRNE